MFESNSSETVAMGEAFSRDGHSTPKEQAKELLAACWQDHKPDVMATLRAFVGALEAASPLAVAVVGQGLFLQRVQAFAYNNGAEIQLAIRRATTGVQHQERIA